MKISVKIQIISLLFLITIASAFSLNLMSVIEGFRPEDNRIFGGRQSQTTRKRGTDQIVRTRYINKLKEEERKKEREESGVANFRESSTTSSIQSSISSRKSLVDMDIETDNRQEICIKCEDPIEFNVNTDETARSLFCDTDSMSDPDHMIYNCSKYMIDPENSDKIILCNKCNKYSFKIQKTSLQKKWSKLMEERNEKVTSMISNYMDDTLGNEMSVKQAGDDLKKLVSQPLGGRDAQGACGDTNECHFKEVHHNIYPNQYDVGILGCAIEEQLE